MSCQSDQNFRSHDKSVVDVKKYNLKITIWKLKLFIFIIDFHGKRKLSLIHSVSYCFPWRCNYYAQSVIHLQLIFHIVCILFALVICYVANTVIRSAVRGGWGGSVSAAPLEREFTLSLGHYGISVQRVPHLRSWKKKWQCPKTNLFSASPNM